MRNLTVVLDNRPGALAGVCEALGQAGVNVEGLCCFASQGVAILYLAVEDGTAARRILERNGLRISEEREVIAAPLADEPGAAGRLLRRIADAGVNVDLAYESSGPRLIIGVKDPARLRAILSRASPRAASGRG